MLSADLILLNGKIITADKNFTIAEAVAISKNKIIAVGSDDNIRKLMDCHTNVIDLKGKTMIPGIIESHLHPEWASISELYEEIPDLRTIRELLLWIKDQTRRKKQGTWIIHPKFFSTRIKELRQATLYELDSVAPYHPVFLNGTYGGMINSTAMKVSGITENTVHPGILRDEKTGMLTGFIRASGFSLLKIPSEKRITEKEKRSALREMMKRYNRYGITSLCSGSGDVKTVEMYLDMSRNKELTTRVAFDINLQLESGEITTEKVREVIKNFNFVTGSGDEWIRIGPLKIIMDGGILTGTAYLREPWGKKACEIFGIDDPGYRGILNYSRNEVLTIVSIANELDWSFTAHAAGGGSVDLLLDVYDEVNKSKPITDKRFSIIHGNFFNEESIKKMSELHIRAEIQPAWFYKDADAMEYILGKDRIKTFHPDRSLIDAGIIVNFGSDHMVKWDADTSINPFNPFLAIWTSVTRITERGTVIMPEEAINREEALKMYTINNAYATFDESLKGSLEPGKLADLAILSDDILTCSVDKIKEIKSVMTIVDGEIVYSSTTDL